MNPDRVLARFACSLARQARHREIVKGTIVKETIVKETIVKETIVKETIVKETIVKETIVIETALSCLGREISMSPDHFLARSREKSFVLLAR